MTDFNPIQTAPQDKNILLLCRVFSGLVIQEGYWEENKNINSFHPEPGYWKPYCGDPKITSTEFLDTIGWCKLPEKTITDGSHLFSAADWEKRIKSNG